MKRLALAAVLLALAQFQGCAGMDVRPPDEFGYRRNFNPPA